MGSKREFLMLAHEYGGEEPIGSWYWSEKLDGCRAYWDGGITRGKMASEIPFANTEKDARYREPPRATGLWSRYGKPIQAPAWWLDGLPDFPLDGELYLGRGRFQELMSRVKRILPREEDWYDIEYVAFESPPYSSVFANGEINNAIFRKTFSGIHYPMPADRPATWDFHSVYQWLRSHRPEDVWRVHEQNRLPTGARAAQDEVARQLQLVVGGGGEGLMVRNPGSYWTPHRSRALLKVKALLIAEATVTGYTWGRETDKGSKLLGMMGALVVEFNDRRLELSGFTEAERKMCFSEPCRGGEIMTVSTLGALNAGKDVQGNVHNPAFPRGSRVMFCYRELTDAGVPKEARYYRQDPGGVGGVAGIGVLPVP